MSFPPMDDSDSDTNSQSNSINKYLNEVGPDLATSPEFKNKKTKIPILSDEDSSDSYSLYPGKKRNKDFESSQRQKSETNDIFTTSKDHMDYTKLEGKLPDSQSDDEDSERITRRPPPSSVAFHLRQSSDDDDGTIKPKSKPKMPLRRMPAESTAPKKIRFDDSVSQRNERPKARSTAPSVSSTRSSRSSKSRTWTPEVIEENPLDRELKQLEETESRIDAAEREKLLQDDFFIGDKMSQSGDNKSQKSRSSRKQVQQQDQESDDESLSKPLQTVAEEQYAKMLKKKFPQLVKKKVYQQNMQNNKYKLNFNNDIINWSREMISNANESIQKEIDQINKELKRLRRENREIKEDIKYYQHQ